MITKEQMEGRRNTSRGYKAGVEGESGRKTQYLGLVCAEPETQGQSQPHKLH